MVFAKFLVMFLLVFCLPFVKYLHGFSSLVQNCCWRSSTIFEAVVREALPLLLEEMPPSLKKHMINNAYALEI